MTNWTLLHPRASFDMLGFLPEMLSERDPRPAREQFHDAYSHGGGWNDFQGFTFSIKGDDHTTARITYPGDPPQLPIGMTKLRDETIYLFQHAWVVIRAADGSTQIARMD